MLCSGLQWCVNGWVMGDCVWDSQHSSPLKSSLGSGQFTRSLYFISHNVCIAYSNLLGVRLSKFWGVINTLGS